MNISIIIIQRKCDNNLVGVRKKLLSDIGKLIELLENLYAGVNDEWNVNSPQVNINLRKKQVIDIDNDYEIKKHILDYVDFLNDHSIYIDYEIKKLDFISAVVTERVKARNSIEYKIDNYIKNHAEGKIPINKCINDLLGIRIILDDSISHEDIRDFVANNYPNYKCIDSSKMEYIATHVYIQDSNFKFPWELQIWIQEDAEQNKESHKKYKQDYTVWESQLMRKEVPE